MVDKNISGWGVRITPKYLSMLGLATDTAIAKKFGVSQFMVGADRRARNIPRFCPSSYRDAGYMGILGTASDAVVAWLSGVPRATVRMDRIRHGIPKHGLSRFDEVFRQKLGVTPDAVLAAEYGVNPQCIAVVRKRLGIGI